MGLNEDLGDRENVGNASISMQRFRESKERFDVFCNDCKNWTIEETISDKMWGQFKCEKCGSTRPASIYSRMWKDLTKCDLAKCFCDEMIQNLRFNVGEQRKRIERNSE
jgi:hypothetical protein